MSAAAERESAGIRRIVLMGLRGSGKTSVGRMLAQRLNWAFVDLDAEIEERAGRSVRELFERSGEMEFRKRESETLAAVIDRDHCVIALGGGTVLLEENRGRLNSDGALRVWLQAEAGTLAERLLNDPRTTELRPRLTGAGGWDDELRLLLQQRRPLYAALADVTIRTDGRTPPQVVEDILLHVESGTTG